MGNVWIKVEALDENASPKSVSKALHPEKGVHLLFAPPEYLLRGSRIKKICADEKAQVRVLSVLVDVGHVIHEWAKAG